MEQIEQIEQTEQMEQDVKLLVVVNLSKICRFCLRSDGAMTSIFEELEQIAPQLASLFPMDLVRSENLPSKVCHRCRYMIETCHNFKIMLAQSYKTLSEASSKSDIDQLPRDDLCKDEDDQSNLFFKSFILKDDMGEKFEKKEKINNNSSINLELKSKKNVIKKAKAITNARSKAEDCPRIYSYKKSQCQLCLEYCKDEQTLKMHIDNHLVGTNLEPYYQLGERDITCGTCNQFFSFRYNFLKHQREHLQIRPFECTFNGCKSNFCSKAALRHHLSIHADRNYICTMCAVRFKRKSDLKAHEIIHEDAGVSYECSICNFKCKNRLTRKSHMKKHLTNRKFKCGSCPKEFYSASELKRHEYVHMTEKRFRCDQCTYAYYSQSALTRHIKAHHSLPSSDETRKEYQKCDLCWQNHSPILAKHHLNPLNDSLQKVYSYRCENCNNGFYEELCLKNHAEYCITTHMMESSAERIA